MSRKYRPGERWKLVDGEVLTVLESLGRIGGNSCWYKCQISDATEPIRLSTRQLSALLTSATKL
jgi:hypothetical protein